MALIKGKQIANATITPANATADFLTNVGTTPAFNAQSQQIQNLLPGVAPTDAVNVSQLTAIAGGLSWKDAAQFTTTANITLTGLAVQGGGTWAAAPPLQVLVAGDRVLVKNQTTATENGIYIAAAGAWTRAPDMAVGSDAAGAAVIITKGTALADTMWVETFDPAIIPAALVFTQVPISPSVFTAGLGIDPAQLALNIIQALPATPTAGTGAAAVGAIKLVASGISVQLAPVNTVPTSGPTATGGLQTVAGGGLSVRLEAAGVNTGGIELAGGSPGDMRIQVAPSLVGSPVNTSRGGLQLTATGLSTRIAFQTGGPPGPLQGGGLQIFGGISPAIGLSVLLEAGGVGTGGLTLAGPGATPPGTTNNAIRVNLSAPVAGTGATAVGGLKLTATGLTASFAPVVLGTGPTASGGLRVNNVGEISVALDPPGAGTGGLRIAGTGEIRVDASPTGGLGLTGVGLAVNAGNGILVGANVAVNFSGGAPPSVNGASSAGVATSVARSDHTHQSPRPVLVDHNLTAIASSVINQAVAPPITFNPAFGPPPAGNGSYVQVKMNGIQYVIGNGVVGGTNIAFYWALPGPSGPAKLLADVVAGDQLFTADYNFSGSSIFPTTTQDYFDFDYLAFY